MTKSSARRKSLRAMYKWNKERAKSHIQKTAPVTPKAPLVDKQAFRVPRVKRALSRVIEYEAHRPGEFAAWIADLHIEHYRAGIQERLEKQRAEESKNSQEQTDGKSEAARSVYIA